MASTARRGLSRKLSRRLKGMSFEQPAPDLSKLLAAWEAFEAGEELPGKVLAKLKTAGLPEVLKELVDSGWSPSS